MDKTDIAKARGIGLATVIEGFGGLPDPADPKNNWKTHAGRITVTDEKFYNHDADKGGGGAIDLAMHLGGFGFKDAVAWLGGTHGRDAAVQTYQAEAKHQATRILDTTEKPKLEIPEQDPRKLPKVKAYLTNTRGIPEQIVDIAIEKGRLWADKYGNAVFALRDLEGNMSGAELRGTYSKPFHGIRGDRGLYFTGKAASKVAVFVESSIEAMSYQALKDNALVIGTAGSTRDILQSAAKHLEGQGYKIVDGFNADKAGDRLGDRLKQAVTQEVERVRPTAGKDWNIELKAVRAAEKAKIQDKPAMDVER
ncbi:hypothetical protein BK666_24575 [Pseudomonas frederiksbergensis]|uniref:DUF3991 domain-containing protein n=1 Tax=Pseudomonas frederiksbergensis TaxID=104087 RepID=A0A423JUT0_9PSED|nr:DUF3991 and TOPRIM domain-containing protein [Pseudomonas frederiksbergensis]RON41384.1 hypothetical protein BK666_24575 [Pseudomonas frederiksbergensis]